MGNVYEPTKEEYEAYVRDMEGMVEEAPSDEEIEAMQQAWDASRDARLRQHEYINNVALSDLYDMADAHSADGTLPGPLESLVENQKYGIAEGKFWGATEQELVGAWISNEYMRSHDYQNTTVDMKDINALHSYSMLVDDYAKATAKLNEGIPEGHWVPLADRGCFELYFNEDGPFRKSICDYEASVGDVDGTYSKVFDASSYDPKYLTVEHFKSGEYEYNPFGMVPGGFKDIVKQRRIDAMNGYDSSFAPAEERLLQLVNRHEDMDDVFKALYEGEYECDVPGKECVQYNVPVRYDLLVENPIAMKRLEELGYKDYVMTEQYLKAVDFDKNDFEGFSKWMKERTSRIKEEADYVAALNGGDDKARQDYYKTETMKLYEGTVSVQELLDYGDVKVGERTPYLVDAMNVTHIGPEVYAKLDAAYGAEGIKATDPGEKRSSGRDVDDADKRVVDDSSIRRDDQGPSDDYSY